MKGRSASAWSDLGADEVHVWHVGLASPQAAPEGALLSADEGERAARFAFAPDRRRYTVSHEALRLILAGYLSCDPTELRFTALPREKPRLCGESDLRFNLSHSGERALIGVARGREIGVDLEQFREIPDLDGLAARCLAPRELRAWRGLPAGERESSFFTTWTRKEAYLKARGAGLARPLDSFEVTVGGGDRPRLLGDALDPLATAAWEFFDVDAGPGYAAALAVEGPTSRLLCRRFTREEGMHGSRGIGHGRAVLGRGEPGGPILPLARGLAAAEGMEDRRPVGVTRRVPGPYPGSLDRHAAGESTGVGTGTAYRAVTLAGEGA